jgi:uncharacterized protein (DUF362 family)
MQVFVERCEAYDEEAIAHVLKGWAGLFAARIRRGNKVVLKPNWLSHRHKYDPDEWISVITHPTVITAVLRLVLDCLDGDGSVVITDGPQTDSSWDKIMERMLPDRWSRMGREAGVDVRTIDLRLDEWVSKGDVKVGGRRLAGDPLGSTVCDLGGRSEFVGHRPSPRGYYGADYDKAETNRVHSQGHHKYKVSRTILEADVFVNLPKLKTHKKAGITCSLKNLVGINTYKNWLPHHSEGAPEEGGDQFPCRTPKSRLEGALTERFKAFLNRRPGWGRWMVPVKGLGRKVFGETRETVRNGNWHGNDTLWRMVLDLNKVLLYANPDGTLREERLASAKPYISIVDGIVAGEGNGPEAPRTKHAGVLVAGTSPVAVDLACARLMGFAWERIPVLERAFHVRRYPLVGFGSGEIVLTSSDPMYQGPLLEIRPEDTLRFLPHFGWEGHIELPRSGQAEESEDSGVS